jgi:hypothetical protein
MNNIEKLVEMFGGGKVSTWNLLAPYFCGDCDGEDDKCDHCQAPHTIGMLEEQLAGSAFEHVKVLIKEWAKNSVVLG